MRLRLRLFQSHTVEDWVEQRNKEERNQNCLTPSSRRKSLDWTESVSNPPVISRRWARGGRKHNGNIRPVFCCLAIVFPCLSPLWPHLRTQQLLSVVASRYQLFLITRCLPLATAPLVLMVAVFTGLSHPQVASDSSSFPLPQHTAQNSGKPVRR